MTISLASQQAFFDQENHRITTDQILNPTQAQLWEYDQLLAPLKASPPAKTTIIDLGSGSGRLTFELIRRGFQVVAYDISQDSLASLLALYQQTKQPGWGSLTITSQLPKSGCADFIVGCDILHHVPLPTSLISWRKLLKPSGMALFSEPNALNLLWYVHLMLHKIPWKIEQGLLQCWSANLQKVFLAAGFKTCQIYGHGLIPTPLPIPKKIAAANALKWAKKLPNLAFRLQIQAR